MIKSRSVEELRRQAEERLLESKQKVTAPSTPEELRRLVQELEVHQIELELQNEELQQARSELEKHLTKYTDLYDFAPVGYFTLDQNGSILSVNLNGTRMFRVERSVILNQHFVRFISSEYRPAFSAFLERVFQNRSQETIDIALQIEGHGEIYAHL